MTPDQLSKLIKKTTKIGNKYGHRSEKGRVALIEQSGAKRAFREEHGEEALLAVMMPSKGGFKLQNSKGEGTYGV